MKVTLKKIMLSNMAVEKYNLAGLSLYEFRENFKIITSQNEDFWQGFDPDYHEKLLVEFHKGSLVAYEAQTQKERQTKIEEALKEREWRLADEKNR